MADRSEVPISVAFSRVREVMAHDRQFAESTIRTHVTSRMCVHAPDHHGTVYADLERVGRGRYRRR